MDSLVGDQQKHNLLGIENESIDERLKEQKVLPEQRFNQPADNPG